MKFRMFLFVAVMWPIAEVECAEFTFKNNTNNEVSFAVLFKSSGRSGGPFSTISHVTEGKGFYSVTPGNSKKITLTRFPSIEHLWLHVSGWTPKYRDSITLSTVNEENGNHWARLPRNNPLRRDNIRVSKYIGKATQNNGRVTFFETRISHRDTFSFGRREDRGNARAGGIRISNGYDKVKIRLYHPDAPRKPAGVWNFAGPEKAVLSNKTGSRVRLAGDWQIDIVFGNGVVSKRRWVSKIGVLRSNTWDVDAARIFDGRGG